MWIKCPSQQVRTKSVLFARCSVSLVGSQGGCVECCLSFDWSLSTAINTTVQSGSLHTCLAVTPDDTQYVVVTMRGSKKFDIVVVGVDCWMTLNRLASPCFRECVCSGLELAALLSEWKTSAVPEFKACARGCSTHSTYGTISCTHDTLSAHWRPARALIQSQPVITLSPQPITALHRARVTHCLVCECVRSSVF